jgi:hypothetical protein
VAIDVPPQGQGNQVRQQENADGDPLEIHRLVGWFCC